MPRLRFHSERRWRPDFAYLPGRSLLITHWREAKDSAYDDGKFAIGLLISSAGLTFGLRTSAFALCPADSAEDGPEWQEHIGNKQRRRELATQFKNPKSPIKIVIVRDMWLTGIDAPCLRTMHADKPMQGHGLMQASARVNRC